jgi:hypothetical protein
MGYLVAFVFDFECNIEKSDTYDRKPEEVSKHLNFFHREAGTFISIQPLRYSIYQLYCNCGCMFIFKK